MIEVNERLDRSVINIPVDNAAYKVANEAVAQLKISHPLLVMIVTRDSCHSIDLPCGDSANAECLKNCIGHYSKGS